VEKCRNKAVKLLRTKDWDVVSALAEDSRDGHTTLEQKCRDKAVKLLRAKDRQVGGFGNPTSG
jgi:hypothetical protein